MDSTASGAARRSEDEAVLREPRLAKVSVGEGQLPELFMVSIRDQLEESLYPVSTAFACWLLFNMS